MDGNGTRRTAVESLLSLSWHQGSNTERLGEAYTTIEYHNSRVYIGPGTRDIRPIIILF